MLRKLAFMVAIGSALWLTAAHALGLGEIDVKSRLNQRFSAVIPLTAVNAEEAESLLVRLADNDDFAKAGIDRADYLNALNFEVKMDANNPRIVISSKQIAREPFLSFLLDVRGKNGRVLREYTVLLDPPSYADNTPVAAPAAPAKSASDFYQTAEEAAQSSKPSASNATPPAAPVEMVAAPESTPAAVSGEGQSTYGPVQSQETFWSIATKLRPGPSVTMDQMLWALYSNNAGAFEGGRIGGLRKGSVLKVPSASQIAAVSPQLAKTRVAQLRGGHAATAKRKALPKLKVQTESQPAAAVVAQPEPAPAPKPEIKPEPKPQAKPAPAATPPAEKKTPENVAPAPAAVTPPPPAAPAAAASLPPKPETPAQAAAATTAASPSAASAAQAPAEAPAPAAVPADQAAATTPPPAAEPAPLPPLPPPVAPPAPVESGWSVDDLMLPVGGGIAVLLLALLGFRAVKQKKARGDKEASVAAPAKPSANLQFWKKKAEDAGKTPAAPPVPAMRTAKFATPPLPPSAAAAKSPMADPLAQTALDSKKKDPSLTQTLANTLASTALTQTVKEDPSLSETAQLPNFDSTQIFDSPSDRQAKSIGTDTVDFDIAGKFEAETLKIDLDANDPVSEADFHLAYGLYDEAALLLESAAEKNPARSDIRVKLAETYFRASKPHEFEEVAQSLKPQLDAGEWQKIAIMGSQLLPDNPLFKGAAQDAMLGDAVDLAFDEPEIAAPAAAAPAAEKPKASSTGAFNASGAYSASSSSVLDFKLEDLEPPSAKPEPKAEGRMPTGNTLEFNLSEFDLGKPGDAGTALPAADNASETLAFDLGADFKAPAATAEAAITPADDIKLDDFDLGEIPTDSHAISGGDEAGTKLDLARAYVDMGDNEMARSLLNEVLQQGNGDQKKEAQALIQRLA